MRTQYDVIIVGARVAGAALAYELSQKGLEVLLLDRSVFPSDTLSTHNMFGNSLAMLREMGVLEQLLATNTPRYSRSRIQFGDSLIDGHMPEAGGESGCLCIRRTYLDHILFEHAQRQPRVSAYEGFRVLRLTMEDGKAAGVEGKFQDGRTACFTAPLVVGADGRLSLVRRSVGAERKLAVPTDFASYVGYYAGYEQEGEPHAEFYKWEDKLAISFPTSDGLHVVGVMVPLDSESWKERFQRDAAEGMLELIGQGFAHTTLPQRMRQAKLQGPVRGLHGYDNDFYAGMGPGWALVGDALSFKDPAIGQGMHDALFGARTLASILAGYGPDRWSGSWAEMAAAYQSAMEAKLLTRFHIGCQLTKNVPITPQEEHVNRLIGSDAEATRVFLGLYNYTSEPEDIQREVARLLGTEAAAAAAAPAEEA